MVCENFELISEYFEGKLDKETAEHLEPHLLQCKECSMLLKFYRSVKPLPKLKPPKEIFDNIQYKLSKPTFINVIKYKLNSIFDYIMDHFQISVVTAIIFLGIFIFNHYDKSDLVKVTFSVPMGDVKSVALVGDFNSWDANKGQLNKQDDVWTGTFYVSPGRYQYMLIVNGNQWIPDPNSKEYMNDGYGSKNSLLDTTKL